MTRSGRRPRHELRLTRADDSASSLVVRSRHRFRFLAELSRRLDADHVRLLPGCELVVVDVRRDGPLRPRVAVVGSTRRGTGSLAA